MKCVNWWPSFTDSCFFLLKPSPLLVNVMFEWLKGNLATWPSNNPIKGLPNIHLLQRKKGQLHQNLLIYTTQLHVLSTGVLIWLWICWWILRNYTIKHLHVLIMNNEVYSPSPTKPPRFLWRVNNFFSPMSLFLQHCNNSSEVF